MQSKVGPKMAAAKLLSDVMVQFDLLSPGGPALAYHVGCLVNDVLFVHGGVSTKMSTDPLSKLYYLDLSQASPLWQEMRAPGSPALSHHAGLVLENRYILLVGGWDGKVRTSRLHAFDTLKKCWICPEVSGFPQDAGLSSHTVSAIDKSSILVLGREGSARLQRRSGNAWLLKGSIHKMHFEYKAHDINFSIASRSGHTTHSLGSTLAIIGGRSDRNIELHRGYKTVAPCCDLMARLADLIRTKTPLVKEPCGRKQHVSTCGTGVILIHGGETFDGRSRDPVSDMFLVTLKPHIQWFKLADCGVGLAGHVCCVDNNRIIIHGGVGARGVINSQTYQLGVDVIK